jgi:death-on-curing protein
VRYLSLGEVLELHRLVLAQTGGGAGLRDLGAPEAAVAQPRQTFEGQDLYPALVEKAAALGFSLIQNHPFLDGNKRVGHAALETFLLLNGHELQVSVVEAEALVLRLASGQCSRQEFVTWLGAHLRPAG